MLRCPKNKAHDGFVQTVTQVFNHLTTRFIDATGKQYSFPTHTVEKEVHAGKIFCVICSAEAVEVEDEIPQQKDAN